MTVAGLVRRGRVVAVAFGAVALLLAPVIRAMPVDWLHFYSLSTGVGLLLLLIVGSPRARRPDAHRSARPGTLAAGAPQRRAPRACADRLSLQRVEAARLSRGRPVLDR
ncbi:hypothetical protein [Cryptosporangium sp. NPDC048952]|uniref:hypothetical protein n=1 Tax=Cryptosporangium sp. NPDC048952 TaxID=3363961 RepID=UPI00372284B9